MKLFEGGKPHQQKYPAFSSPSRSTFSWTSGVIVSMSNSINNNYNNLKTLFHIPNFVVPGKMMRWGRGNPLETCFSLTCLIVSIKIASVGTTRPLLTVNKKQIRSPGHYAKM